MTTADSSIRKACANCGAPLTGAFCSVCGQKADTQRLSLQTLAGNLLRAIYDMDSKVWRTILDLTKNPGQVALDYIHGGRVRYVNPVKYFRLSFQNVCVDGMIGRNSAPQEGQMDGKRFQDWLAGIDSLSETQRTEALAVLSGQADDVLSLAAVEAKVEEDRHCPHCGTPGAISRGRARGLRRYQCKGCGRTFNAATGTPLSGLHHKERWLTFGASLAEGETVRESASRCGLGVNTAFRWRHRFLAAVGQAPQKLKGIVEVDETYVLESNKGSRTLDRKARRRGGKASKRGLSHEQVPVLVAADRSGTTVSEVLPAVNADTLKAVLEPSVDTDIVLVSDSKSSYRPCAAAMGVRHEALKLSAGERVRDAFHIQTVNSRHSQLKDFLRGYRGIATKYLDRYLNWFHLIGMAEKASPRACLAAAISGSRIQFGN